MEIAIFTDPVAFDLASNTVARLAESGATVVTPEVIRQTLLEVAVEDPRSTPGAREQAEEALFTMYLQVAQPPTA